MELYSPTLYIETKASDSYGKTIFDADALVVTGAPIDWQAFRREAAKDAMCAILSNSKMVDERSWDYVISVVKNAVGYADELIKQLQED